MVSLPQIQENDLRHIKKILNNFKRYKSDSEIFYDLCFCISVPQVSFLKTHEVIKRLMAKNFFENDISIEQLYILTKEIRFKRKARYLQKAKENFSEVLKMLHEDSSDQDRRKWLVKYIYGLGMKTASHFLRNQGIQSLAIIDTHIIKFLESHQPKNEKEYLKMEIEFQDKAIKLNLTTAELDAFVWKVCSGISWDQFVF
jgi:N-glycosylase/DNA lyase